MNTIIVNVNKADISFDFSLNQARHAKDIDAALKEWDFAGLETMSQGFDADKPIMVSSNGVVIRGHRRALYWFYVLNRTEPIPAVKLTIEMSPVELAELANDHGQSVLIDKFGLYKMLKELWALGATQTDAFRKNPALFETIFSATTRENLLAVVKPEDKESLAGIPLSQLKATYSIEYAAAQEAHHRGTLQTMYNSYIMGCVFDAQKELSLASGKKQLLGDNIVTLLYGEYNKMRELNKALKLKGKKAAHDLSAEITESYWLCVLTAYVKALDKDFRFQSDETENKGNIHQLSQGDNIAKVFAALPAEFRDLKLTEEARNGMIRKALHVVDVDIIDKAKKPTGKDIAAVSEAIERMSELPDDIRELVEATLAYTQGGISRDDYMTVIKKFYSAATPAV